MGDLLLTENQYNLILDGTWMTVRILAFSFVLGVVLSLVVGVGRLSANRLVRGLAFVFVELARGISSIVLLFIMAIAIPILLEVGQADLIILASIALGINMGGYGAEIIRGAIQSVPKGQTEATISLNLSPTQRLRHVILPQAMPVILPPMGNLTIEILKGTALVSLVGVTDIMQTVNNIRQQQIAAGAAADITVLFVTVLVLYFVLAQIISGLFRLWERRVSSRFDGGPTVSADELPPSVRGAGVVG